MGMEWQYWRGLVGQDSARTGSSGSIGKEVIGMARRGTVWQYWTGEVGSSRKGNGADWQ
jgi:hypothetical protein